jgi:hypothetical protein
MHYAAHMNCEAKATPVEDIVHIPGQPPAASVNAWYFYWFTNPPAVLAGRSRSTWK